MRYFLLVIAALTFSLSAFAKSDDQYDFRFNPLGILVGAIEADFNIAVDSNWTLGPQLGLLHHKYPSSGSYTTPYDTKAFAAGIRANYFRNGNFTDGLYVGPSLKWAGVKIETNDNNGPVTGSAALTIASCVVGYGWFWDSFNIMLGGGLQLGVGASHVEITNSSGQKDWIPHHVSSLTGEFSLGWTF